MVPKKSHTKPHWLHYVANILSSIGMALMGFKGVGSMIILCNAKHTGLTMTYHGDVDSWCVNRFGDISIPGCTPHRCSSVVPIARCNYLTYVCHVVYKYMLCMSCCIQIYVMLYTCMYVYIIICSVVHMYVCIHMYVYVCGHITVIQMFKKFSILDLACKATVPP